MLFRFLKVLRHAFLDPLPSYVVDFILSFFIFFTFYSIAILIEFDIVWW